MGELAVVTGLQPSRLQTIRDAGGTLMVAEVGRHVPFPIARSFVVTDVKAGSTRGHHAHKQCRQFLVCLSGRLSVRVSDGAESAVLALAEPGDSLYIPPGIWAEQVYETPGTTLLVLCDQPYDESDYLRDHDRFLDWRAAMAKESVPQ